MASDWLNEVPDPQVGAEEYANMARDLQAQGDERGAATAYDLAFGLAPHDVQIASERQVLLDRLAVVEHGICFHYVPAGTFLMGSERGEPDETPVHPVRLNNYWIAEAPISWAKYCELMDWEPPPVGLPRDYEHWDRKAASEEENKRFFLSRSGVRIRLQYCENETTRACDWHAHQPDQVWNVGTERQTTSRQLFGEVPRASPDRPWGYDEKPMVAVGWEQAELLCQRLSVPSLFEAHTNYRLPTEAEWEKAARGGRMGVRYPWGDEVPTPDRCDFDRFELYSIRKVRDCPPNGYGLYAMSGGVSEWTADWYDAAYYAESPGVDPRGPRSGQEHVLRGGSWADCAEAVTVSFRMSCTTSSSPTVGCRLCRVQTVHE